MRPHVGFQLGLAVARERCGDCDRSTQIGGVKYSFDETLRWAPFVWTYNQGVRWKADTIKKAFEILSGSNNQIVKISVWSNKAFAHNDLSFVVDKRHELDACSQEW